MSTTIVLSLNIGDFYLTKVVHREHHSINKWGNWRREGECSLWGFIFYNSACFLRWEIGSNFKCDCESQLGFLTEEGKINWVFFVWNEWLFFSVEGKSISWCERKDYSLVWKKSMFLIKEVIVRVLFWTVPKPK